MHFWSRTFCCSLKVACNESQTPEEAQAAQEAWWPLLMWLNRHMRLNPDVALYWYMSKSTLSQWSQDNVLNIPWYMSPHYVAWAVQPPTVYCTASRHRYTHYHGMRNYDYALHPVSSVVLRPCATVRTDKAYKMCLSPRRAENKVNGDILLDSLGCRILDNRCVTAKTFTSY